MEPRIAKLEEFAATANDRLARIEARLEQMATKADLAELRSEIHRSSNELIRWMVGTAVGLGVAAITVITFVLNNATPKTIPLPAPATPITINTQQPPLPPPASPAAR